MSIIDDALNRLQEKRSSEEGDLDETSSAAPPLPNLRRGKPEQKSGFFYFFGVIAFMAVAGAVWFALDNAQHQQIETARSIFSDPPMVTQPLAAKPKPATQSAEKPADAPEPVKPQETLQKEKPAVEPDAIKTAEAEPEPVPVKETPVAIDKKPESETFEQAEEESIARDTAIAMPEMDENEWLAAGRKVLDEEGLVPACVVWEQGFKTLSHERIALVAGVFKGPLHAARAFKRVGQQNSPLIVRGAYEGEMAYYILSIPPMPDLEKVRASIRKKIGLGAVRGNFVGRFYERMSVLGLDDGQPKVRKKKSRARAPEKRIVSSPKKPAKVAKKRRPVGRVGLENERLSQAQKHVAKGAFSDAVDVLQPLFVTPPRNWQPYFLMGTAHLGLGDLDKADSYLIHGLAIDGTQAGLWVQRAVVAQQKGKDEIALRFLHEAERLDSKSPEVYLNIGFSNDKLGNIEEAAKAYRSFLALTEGVKAFTNMRREILSRLSKLGY